MNSDVPTIDQFRPLVLRVLSDGEPRSAKALQSAVADLAELSPEARAATVSSGQARYVNRIGWACSALSHAGLLRRPQRGVYQITEDGRTVNARNLAAYSETDMLEWPAWASYQDEIKARRDETPYPSDSLTPTSPHTLAPATIAVPSAKAAPGDPAESIEELVAQHNATVETDLRQALQNSTPEFFEQAVVELLWAMGYGGTHGEKQHVGRSGDGGIDGIIRQDALGLQNVYIQAKKYADNNSVGRPEIQQFYGALASKAADRGVFITTSRFTDGAVTEASSYHGKTIVLIDGLKLTQLMLNYGVAVQKRREYTLFQVDEDFFDTEVG